MEPQEVCKYFVQCTAANAMAVAEELALDRFHYWTLGVALGQKRPVNFVSSLNHSHFEIRLSLMKPSIQLELTSPLRLKNSQLLLWTAPYSKYVFETAFCISSYSVRESPTSPSSNLRVRDREK